MTTRGGPHDLRRVTPTLVAQVTIQATTSGVTPRPPARTCKPNASISASSISIPSLVSSSVSPMHRQSPTQTKK